MPKVNGEILEQRAASLRLKGDEGTHEKETWWSPYPVKFPFQPNKDMGWNQGGAVHDVCGLGNSVLELSRGVSLVGTADDVWATRESLAVTVRME